MNGPDYTPIKTLIEADSAQAVNQLITDTYEQEGEEADVVGADSNAQRALSVFMETTPKKAPKISEIVRIQDRTLFAPELEANPNVYPFIIYNLTPDDPVDINYVNFSLHAVRTWINEVDAQGGEIIIGGHTSYTVAPETDPHAVVFTNHMPSFMPAVVRSSIEGRTTWYADDQNTRTFVIADGPPSEPFSLSAISTEACQAMLQLNNAHTIPGAKFEQTAWQQFIGNTELSGPRNPSARHDLFIAGKEAVCNGIGNVIAAYSQGGQRAVDALQNDVVRVNTFLDQPYLADPGHAPGQPWIDYGIYKNLITQLAKLQEEAPLSVITGAGTTSPTTSYYRHHQLDGPFMPTN